MNFEEVIILIRGNILLQELIIDNVNSVISLIIVNLPNIILLKGGTDGIQRDREKNKSL